MIDIALSAMMLSALALLAGAAYLWRVKRNNRQAALMAFLAVIFLINVAIWTIPDANDAALADGVATQ